MGIQHTVRQITIRASVVPPLIMLSTGPAIARSLGSLAIATRANATSARSIRVADVSFHAISLPFHFGSVSRVLSPALSVQPQPSPWIMRCRKRLGRPMFFDDVLCFHSYSRFHTVGPCLLPTALHGLLPRCTIAHTHRSRAVHSASSASEPKFSLGIALSFVGDGHISTGVLI